MKKTLAFLIIFLLFSIIIIPSTVGIIDKTTTITIPGFRGYIQDLIDDASPGDTIYIPSGTYYENIVIDKSINLIGEDRDTTIIDGGGSGTVVFILADRVTVCGFTIQNSGDGYNDVGMGINSNSNTITGNTISNNYYWGIFIFVSFSYNNITGNTISNNEFGITIGSFSNYNTITGNTISNNENGIHAYWASLNNTIYHNNFINNGENAQDESKNTWDDGKYGNYWDDYKERYPKARKKPFKGIWDTPYEIPEGDNKDNYPLINQWSKSKPRTITRNMVTFNSLFYWFLERFPILRVFLYL